VCPTEIIEFNDKAEEFRKNSKFVCSNALIWEENYCLLFKAHEYYSSLECS
jgi:hypothetical protein